MYNHVEPKVTGFRALTCFSRFGAGAAFDGLQAPDLSGAEVWGVGKGTPDP